MIAINSVASDRTNILIAAAVYVVFLALYCFSLDMNGRNLEKPCFVFGANTAAVVSAFEDPASVRDRAHHPLLPVLFKGPSWLISPFAGASAKGARFVTAAAGATAVPLAFLIFVTLLEEPAAALLFTLLFGFSAAVWLANSVADLFSVDAAFGAFAYFLQLRRIPDERLAQLSFHAVFVLAMVLAVGVSIWNGAYYLLALANYHRKNRLPESERLSWIAGALVSFLVLFGALYAVQHALFGSASMPLSGAGQPDAFRTAAAARFSTLSLSPEKPDLAWLGAVVPTVFVNNVVAPPAAINVFTQSGIEWAILGFRSAASVGHVVIVITALAVLMYAVLENRHRLLGPMGRNADAQLAAAFIAFDLLFLSFHRTVGVPLMHAARMTLPIAILLASIYGRIFEARRRLAVGVLVGAMALNNLSFIRRVNVLCQLGHVPSPHRSRGDVDGPVPTHHGRR